MNDAPHPSKPSRKGKEREPTDIFERMIAIQRSKAACVHSASFHSFPLSANRDALICSVLRKEKAERTERTDRSERASATPVAPSSPPRLVRTPQATPQVVVSRTDSAEVVEEPQRRRKGFPGSPRANHPPTASHSRPQGKLFNPDADALHMRRTAEPETISDTGSSSYASRNHLPPQERGTPQGRLFDHRKDDPVRFHVLSRPNPANGNKPTPTPKSSGEYVSASSTSSYAHSITSSNFTLNSTTDGSSASSNLFDQQPREHGDSNAFAQQLKKVYRSIASLEAKVLRDDGKDVVDPGRITLMRSGDAPSKEQEDAEKERWRKFVADHKRYVSTAFHRVADALTASPD